MAEIEEKLNEILKRLIILARFEFSSVRSVIIAEKSRTNAAEKISFRHKYIFVARNT